MKLPTTLPNLVLWLAAEGNTADSSGANPGTLHGGVAFSTGVAAQAFNFNGNASYVDLGTGDDIVGTQAFSVAVWIKTTSNGVIIQQRDASNFNGEYQLAVTGGKVSWTTFGNDQYGYNFTSNESVNDGNWHFVVATRLADGTGQIFIDGKLDSSQAAAPVPLAGGIHVYIGEDVRNAALGASPENFVGLIDEVRIYSRLLAPTDVQALFGHPGDIWTTDQLGNLRMAGPSVDIGATEYQYDLAITGFAPIFVGVNNQITYTLTVTNNGPDAVTGVTITDNLPSSVNFESLSAPQGWTFTTPAVGKGGKVSATDTASLAPGASVTFTLVVQAKVTTEGTVISNTVSVAPTVDDLNTANNFVTLLSTIPIQSAAGVDIHGQPANGVVDQAIGGPITVAVVDANGNTLPTSNQLVTLSIFSGPVGALLMGTRTVQAVDGVATFTNLRLNLAGVYTLEATGGKLTPDFSNQFVIKPADVSADVQVDRGRLKQNQNGLYQETLTITNISDQTLAGPLAFVIEGLPKGVTLSDASGTWNGSPYVEIGGSLKAGHKVRVTLLFSITDNYPSDLDFGVQTLLGL